MTREETARILASLKAAYPASFRDTTWKDGEVSINVWQTIFAEDSYETVSRAVFTIINSRTEEFVPPPGMVRRAIEAQSGIDRLSESKAWGFVRKALSNSLYGAEKEFNALPQEVRKAVGSPDTLRQWAALECSEVDTVIASNFMREFRNACIREQEYLPLPGLETALSASTLFPFALSGAKADDEESASA